LAPIFYILDIIKLNPGFDPAFANRPQTASKFGMNIVIVSRFCGSPLEKDAILRGDIRFDPN
jgi:hypothetical protein